MLTEDMAKVERKVQDYLLDGEIIEVGDVKFRFAKRGIPFDDGDWTFEPRESGVFQLFSGGDRPHWVFVGHVDEIDGTIMRLVSAMSDNEREEWYVGMTASIALRDINHSKRNRP